VFQWIPARAIGVPEIDAQHVALFEEAARIEAAVRARDPEDRLRALLGSLADHAVEHFMAEEQLMRDVGYPRLAEHLQEHAYILRRFRSLVPRWESEGDSAARMRALLGFLDLWLNTHIANSDRQIGDFIGK
jgi:hemerythrin-like metal-binding protein